MQIIEYPDPRLLLKSSIVSFDSSLNGIIEDMRKTLESSGGVGLSAPQVGINICLFITRKDIKSPIIAYINPKITFPDHEMVDSTEGCLSIPGKVFKVRRYRHVRLVYQDIFQKTLTRRASGFEAIIFQHEFEHLSGLLINRFEEN